MTSQIQLSGDYIVKVHAIASEMDADEKTVYRRIRDGKLKAFKEGGRWVMWHSDLSSGHTWTLRRRLNSTQVGTQILSRSAA
jgi:hypothetical protein